jgi:hypothetical protein
MISRSGVAEKPGRRKPLPRRYRSIKPTTAAWDAILALFRQIGWLLVTSNLASKLKTYWRILARELTVPTLHKTKKPRKHKSSIMRPF